MKPPIDLDSRFQGATIQTFQTDNDHVNLTVNGISPEYKENYQYSFNSRSTRHQTVVLAQGTEWEIVIELRPRRYSPAELQALAKRT
jgi:hypothetical protein